MVSSDSLETYILWLDFAKLAFSTFLIIQESFLFEKDDFVLQVAIQMDIIFL